MIAPGMFMALAVGLMVWPAMFIPWVDMLESDRVVGFEEEHTEFQDVGEATIRGNGLRGREWDDVICRAYGFVLN